MGAVGPDKEPPRVTPQPQDDPFQGLNEEDKDAIGLARSLMLDQEYDNAAHILTLRYGPDRTRYPRVPLFMWAYASYLVSNALSLIKGPLYRILSKKIFQAGDKSREISMAESEGRSSWNNRILFGTVSI